MACLAAAVLMYPCGRAQYDQNISVEGKYIPVKVDRDRLGVFPRPVKAEIGSEPLPWDMAGTVAGFTPRAVPMAVSAWGTDFPYSDSRGYATLGLGSWLDSDLSAGWRFIDDGTLSAGVRLQFNSSSLWRGRALPGRDGIERENLRRRYDGKIGVYASRKFGDSGTLRVEAGYGAGHWNYFALPFDRVPRQTLNDVAARIGWESTESWRVSAGVRHVGMWRFYTPYTPGAGTASEGTRETDIMLEGSGKLGLHEGSSLNAAVRADMLVYGESQQPLAKPGNYGNITIVPGYRFSRSGVNVEAGVRIDLTFNAGPEGGRYGVFHAAPAVRADWNAGPVCLFFRAAGGTELNTMAAMRDRYYYCSPAVGSSMPVYTPLDARIGFSFGPFSGFSAGIEGAWKSSRGIYMEGWYQPWVSACAPETLGLPATWMLRPLDYDLSPGKTRRMSGFEGCVRAAWDGGKVLKVEGEARYTPQTRTGGYYNGLDLPRWRLSLKGESNPWSTLHLTLGYEARLVRNAAAAAHYADTTPLNSNLVMFARLPDVTDLYFRAGYEFAQGFGVWAEGRNLLGTHTLTAPGVGEPGVTVMAGVSIVF